MPAPPSQAVRPVENNRNKYGPGLATMRKNGFAFGAFTRQGKPVIFSYRKKWIRWQKSKIPSTDANDNCQPASNKDVGLISRRIIAQASIFTVHAILTDGSVLQFEHHLKYNENLIKVIIPHAKFPELRKELHILGINHSSLFPDLDGLANFLRWRFVKFDDE